MLKFHGFVSCNKLHQRKVLTKFNSPVNARKEKSGHSTKLYVFSFCIHFPPENLSHQVQPINIQLLLLLSRLLY